MAHTPNNDDLGCLGVRHGVQGISLWASISCLSNGKPARGEGWGGGWGSSLQTRLSCPVLRPPFLLFLTLFRVMYGNLTRPLLVPYGSSSYRLPATTPA